MSKNAETLKEARKPKLGISGVRRSFSNYAIFEIQDKGIIKMVFTGDAEKEHSFPTREEAIEWLINYADDFRR
jgi:hypothetical protein